MSPSKQAYDLIRQEEGFRSLPYMDSNGFSTIGFGHKVLPGETFGAISTVEGQSLLEKDLSKVVSCINHNVTYNLNQNQFDALCSFVFNIGCGNFCSSEVFKNINVGKMDKAAQAFKNWHTPNLMGRRLREIALFTKPLEEKGGSANAT